MSSNATFYDMDKGQMVTREVPEHTVVVEPVFNDCVVANLAAIDDDVTRSFAVVIPTYAEVVEGRVADPYACSTKP